MALLTGVSTLGAAVSIAILIAMRRGLIGSNPPLFATIAAVVLVLALLSLAAAIVKRSVAAALFSAGLLLVYSGGMANFLFSLQGYALLTEFEAVRLADATALQAFEAGPLSNVEEMNLTMQLENVELLPAPGGFVPLSRIRLLRSGAGAKVIDVSQTNGVADGTLRFIQGAFGFAPRIVVTRNGEAVFDRHVPFVTRQVGGGGVTFTETFDIAPENMRVRGALDLRSLGEAMKGHARLGVSVQRDGKELGRGELSMGHFARLSDGSYIGYAGLKRWSEIDISRRNYPEPIFAGAALLLLSGLALPFSWRKK